MAQEETLLSPPDEPTLAYRLACSKACYGLLRALHAAPATAKRLADGRGVSVAAVSPSLQKLTRAGLIHVREVLAEGAVHELTPDGRDILARVGGLVPLGAASGGWLVTAKVDKGDSDQVRRALQNSQSDVLGCAGDADYIALFAPQGPDLAIELTDRIRAAGGVASRIFVIGDRHAPT